jgi:ABC-type glycerol-3-phosphate transport system substrate-binding protein
MNRVRSFLYFSLVCLTAGCTPSRESGGPKLVYWHVGSEEEAQIISRLAEQRFTPATGIKVQCDSVAWGEAHSKYLTAMAGDVVPDVGAMGLTWGTEFGSKGQMVDLRQAFPAELEAIKSNTFASVWAATEYKGFSYALPFDMTLQVLYYRKDMVPHPPKTWADLTRLLADLNKQNRGMVIDWGFLDWIGFSPFLWQAGGDYYTPDGARAAIDSPAAVKALSFYADLHRKYKVPQSSQGIAQGMRSGLYPLGISGNWLINSLAADAPELEGKWDLALLPAGPTGKPTAFIGGRSIGIFAKSARKNDAWAFITFLCEKETQQAIYTEIAKSHNIYMPPNVHAWDDLPIPAPLKTVLIAQAQAAKAPPSVLGWDDSTRFVAEAVQNAVVAGKDPATVLAVAAKAMNEKIER